MAAWNKGQFGTLANPGYNRTLRWVGEHLGYRGDACLTWPFSHDGRGYGHLGYGGKMVKAHRFICELTHGAPPSPKHQAAHSCGNGHLGCVNPAHLSWKMPSENYKESAPHRRFKLNPTQVAEIKALKGIEPAASIAARYGVIERTIRKIHSGETWKTGEYPIMGFARKPYRGGRPKK